MTSRTFWKPLLATPAFLGALAFFATGSAVKAAEVSSASSQSNNPLASSTQIPAQPVTLADASVTTPTSANAPSTNSLAQIGEYGAEGRGEAADQVTSVSQLTDVRPTDWAFQALQSLVERYGCIVGYPDRKYRGNQALTRYEFAAGLNACLDRVNELIAAGTADLVKKEDLLALQKLQEEFAAELATLRGRVDALEARTTTLEKQQFSTTTKLAGEVIFSISDTFGDAATRVGRTGATAATNRDDNTETVFSDRVRLALDTSFTGKDRLRTRLQARNTTPFSGALTGTNMTRLSYDGDESNSVFIDKLNYRFPLGDNLRIQIDAANDEFYDALISTLSPFESSGLGAVSRFGRFNPIYRVNNPTLRGGDSALSGGAGISFAYKFNDAVRLEGGYSADNASNDPTAKNGLFNGSYTAIGQLVFTPNRAFTVGLTYAHSYYPGSEVNVTGSTGSSYASNPFAANAVNGRATSADSFAAALQFRLSPQFIVGGWFGAQFAHQRNSGNDATILNGAAYLAFPDLGKKGNLAGILVGVPPKVTDNDFVNAAGVAREDDDTTLHVEAFYRYRITDNIAITPGLFVLFNPEHNNSNDTQFVGTIRTTFTF